MLGQSKLMSRIQIFSWRNSEGVCEQQQPVCYLWYYGFKNEWALTARFNHSVIAKPGNRGGKGRSKVTLFPYLSLFSASLHEGKI